MDARGVISLILLMQFAGGALAVPIYPTIPADMLNVTETCEFLGDPLPMQVEYGNRYSWAIPTEEAIHAIASYEVPVVDFGAGSGYWSMLLKQAGVDVVAYDDWSWGRPEQLWFPVKRGGVDSLVAHDDRAMLLVYPPNNSLMAVEALRNWDGDLLFYVGELLRVTGTPEFIRALHDDWHLVRRVNLPNWRGKVDELYILRRGDPDPSWMKSAMARCGIAYSAAFPGEPT